MYLELKSKIPVVAARTAVGRERLQAAQDAVGLSNERLARLIPVSTKTWERWKKAGEIPTQWLPQVARALRLELVEAPAVPAVVELRPTAAEPLLARVAETVADLAEGQQELLAEVATLGEKLDELLARRRAPRARRTS